jgi:hypothetical protein
MRIYYFGKLIQDTDKNEMDDKNKNLDGASDMQTVGEILNDLNINIDTYHQRSSLRIRNSGGHTYA